MTVLALGGVAGNFSDSDAYPGQFYLSAKAYAFVATETVTITEIHLVTDSRTSDATDLELAIFSGYGDTAVDSLISCASYGGPVASSSEIIVTGLSAPVVAGEVYWIAGKAHGGHVYWSYDGASGPSTRYEQSGGEANLSDDTVWPGGSGGTIAGPPGLAAYGIAAVTMADGPHCLTFELTDLWRPDAEAVTVHGLVVDPTAGNVSIPLCDSRTGTVTFSAESDLAERLAGLEQITYNIALRAWWGRDCVLWGVVHNMVLDSDACTVTLTAMDPTLRLTRHYFRDGDHLIDDTLLVESSRDPDGYLPLSGAGLLLVRDAGETDSFPTLGIINGTDTFGPATLSPIGVSRGDQCFDIWQQISQSLGPEWDLPPETSTPQAYCSLDTFDRKGEDRTATVQLLLGAHADRFKFTEGRKYTNLAHVLDRNAKFRETRVNATTCARTGPYIDWDATDYAAAPGGEDDTRAVLDAAGDEILDAYSLPLREVDAVLAPDRLRYLTHFTHGDTIGAAPQIGRMKFPLAAHRIVAVTLELDGENTNQTLTILPDDTIEPAGGDPS